MEIHRIEYIRKTDNVLVTKLLPHEKLAKMCAVKVKKHAKDNIVLRSKITLEDCRVVETYVTNKKLTWA